VVLYALHTSSLTGHKTVHNTTMNLHMDLLVLGCTLPYMTLPSLLHMTHTHTHTAGSGTTVHTHTHTPFLWFHTPPHTLHLALHLCHTYHTHTFCPSYSSGSLLPHTLVWIPLWTVPSPYTWFSLVLLFVHYSMPFFAYSHLLSMGSPASHAHITRLPDSTHTCWHTFCTFLPLAPSGPLAPWFAFPDLDARMPGPPPPPHWVPILPPDGGRGTRTGRHSPHTFYHILPQFYLFKPHTYFIHISSSFFLGS